MAKPGVYLTTAYQQGGMLGLVFYELATGQCSFLTLRGKRVLRFGDLGKVDPTNIGDMAVIFGKEDKRG